MASEDKPIHFDICIANILRGPLLDLQPRLSSYVKPGGQLLLSGILVSQVSSECPAPAFYLGVLIVVTKAHRAKLII